MRLSVWRAVSRSASALFAKSGLGTRTPQSRAGRASFPKSLTRRAFLPTFSRTLSTLTQVVRARRSNAGLHHHPSLRASTSRTDIGAHSGPISSPCGSCVLLNIDSEMRAGLVRGEFVPYYQPIISLETGLPVGFESLARWEHPLRGTVAPDNFISRAEDSGLIHELSLQLLERACADMRAWPAHLTLSINLSPLQLDQAWIAPSILRILYANGVAPGRLIIELTESRSISHLERARQVLQSLKQTGIQLALDDFGVEHSNLMRLQELKFDRLKIDRTFTAELTRTENCEMVRAMLNLGDSLGMSVVAEGVETRFAAAQLARLGCAYAQGFLYSPPVSADAALDLMSSPMPTFSTHSATELGDQARGDIVKNDVACITHPQARISTRH